MASKMAVVVVFLSLLVPRALAEAPDTPYVKPVLNPALFNVCTCESGVGQGLDHPSQYNIVTGEVLHGVKNSDDIGECQINEYWNGKTATEHGWDIYTEDGNIQMANYLYDAAGLRPWNWSKSCWSKK